MKVGDPVWYFDENRRVYKPGTMSPPIWREHWVRKCIIGETSRSWIVGYERQDPRDGQKLSKKELAAPERPKGWAFSEEEIDRLAWMHENRHALSEAVRRCRDYRTLKEIAALIAFEVTS
jgi:hypothetical protein